MMTPEESLEPRCKHCGQTIEGAGGIHMDGTSDWWRHIATRRRSCVPGLEGGPYAVPAPESLEEQGRDIIAAMYAARKNEQPDGYDEMEPGPPCAVCGEPEWEPITPWKSNFHPDEDHAFVPAPSPEEPRCDGTGDLSSDDMMAILGQRVQAVYGFGLEEYIEARRAGTLPYKPGGAALEVFAGDFDTKAHADAERAEAEVARLNTIINSVTAMGEELKDDLGRAEAALRERDEMWDRVLEAAETALDNLSDCSTNCNDRARAQTRLAEILALAERALASGGESEDAG